MKFSKYLLLFLVGTSFLSAKSKYRNEEYYNPNEQNVQYRQGDLATAWTAPPRQSGWQNQQLSSQHLEEILGLMRAALSERFPTRQKEYTLAIAGGGVRIKGPEDIQEAAAMYMGAVMLTRRLEMALTLEHFGISRDVASRLDQRQGPLLDDETVKMIRKSGKRLGILTALGNQRLVAANYKQHEVAYLNHVSVLPTIDYKRILQGGWFEANVTPAGPSLWSVDLNFLLAWDVSIREKDADFHYPVGQNAIKGTAKLKLPSWTSLAYRGVVQIPGGHTMMVVLNSSAPGSKHAYEVVLVSLSDPLYSIQKGPTAVVFDGTGLVPAQVVETMREIAKKDVKVWSGGSLLLLDDVSLRPLFIQALKEVMPVSESQRLSLLLGKGGTERSQELADNETAKSVANFWQNDNPTVFSLTVSSAQGAARAKLARAEVPEGVIGLDQKIRVEELVMIAGCAGVGKRRHLAVSSRIFLGSEQESTEIQRTFEAGQSMLLPASRADEGMLIRQSGKIIDVEGYFAGEEWGRNVRH